MRTLNLGILAHVDAGKTSLTERLLHAAGVIDRLGRVDDGDTQTDTLTLERQRGITIKSAVTSFMIDDITVNLIDTPGHPDFIAEVERVLDVLDGVVLVISAVEGVQAQTRVLMRALQRLGLPVLIFVNKIDRAGARTDELLPEIERRLDITALPKGTVHVAGTRDARFASYDLEDAGHRLRLADALTKGDDQLLADYLSPDGLDAGRLQEALVTQSGSRLVNPVFFGSAMTGAGVPELMSGIGDLLPSQEPDRSEPAGVIFKIDRGPRSEKICYLRVFGGNFAVRDRVAVRSPDGGVRESKIISAKIFDRGDTVAVDQVPAGRIGLLWGLSDARIGDRLGTPDDAGPGDHYFTPPTLETVVDPAADEDRGRLRVALDQLAEQDPLINVRQDDARSEFSVSLYGEVQKEVIGTTLATDFGVAVTFSETSTICVERPTGSGTAVELIRSEDNPFLATVGLRVEPGAIGSGLTFAMESAVHGTMPPAFYKAIEETVLETAAEALHGWQLTDAVITLTRTGYAPRQSHMHQSFNKAMSSTGADFRDLTPLVLMSALREAGTVVLEPVHRFVLELPNDVLAAVYPVLAARRAIPETPVIGDHGARLEGVIPVAEIHALEQELPPLTRGEGVLDTKFDRYLPVTGKPPDRRRTDRNPLNRREYLLRTTRGKGAVIA